MALVTIPDHFGNSGRRRPSPQDHIMQQDTPLTALTSIHIAMKGQPPPAVHHEMYTQSWTNIN